MNVLPLEMRLRVLQILIEGCSIRATERITGVHRDTCMRLVVNFGQFCRSFLNTEMRDLVLDHVEIDEIWTFVRKKDKNITGQEPDVEKIGSRFIFIAFDEKTKLVPVYRVGRRDQPNTEMFIFDLANRVRKPKPHETDDHAYKKGKVKPIIRISSDGFQSYPEAIDMAFGKYAHYAQVIKKHGDDDGPFLSHKVFTGKIPIKQISTSLVERNNLTMRTLMKRLMRRTICYSKNIDNLEAATAMYIAYYNYCWQHSSLNTSPATAAGLAPRRLTLRELHQEIYKKVKVPWK